MTGRGGVNLFVRKEGTGSFELVTHPPALSGKERGECLKRPRPGWSRGLQGRLPSRASPRSLRRAPG